jgi:formate dehydrogenase subunit beta
MQKLARVAFSTNNVHNCARICPGPSVPLHCGTLPNAKLLKKYLKGAAEMKLGVAVKGCDAMGFYELAKRPHPLPITLSSSVSTAKDSVSPVLARRMIPGKFGVDPNTVHKEEID